MSMEKAMEESVNQAVAEAARPTNIRPVEKKHISLTDQWSVLERHDREFRERFRKERQVILSKYEHDRISITSLWDEKIGDAISKMEQDKHEELATLTNETQAKLTELEMLAKRMAKRME